MLQLNSISLQYMLLQILNIMYAHCFIVYIRKSKLMINICDVTAQMLGTEV